MFDFGHLFSWSMQGSYYALTALLGYLLGSVPFALIYTWLAGEGDVRKIGLGNVGTTNVLRTGKKWAALATLLCDGGKGAAAILIVRALYGNELAAVAGFGSLLGHIFPVWLGFKGGKGMAAFLGVMLALYWPVGVLCLATWAVVAALFKISSLSTLASAALAPVYMILFNEHLYAALALLLAVIVFFAHRSNISRLVKGAEPRIGAKSVA